MKRKNPWQETRGGEPQKPSASKKRIACPKKVWEDWVLFSCRYILPYPIVLSITCYVCINAMRSSRERQVNNALDLGGELTSSLPNASLPSSVVYHGPWGRIMQLRMTQADQTYLSCKIRRKGHVQTHSSLRGRWHRSTRNCLWRYQTSGPSGFRMHLDSPVKAALKRWRKWHGAFEE